MAHVRTHEFVLQGPRHANLGCDHCVGFECNGMIFEASNEAILKEWEDAFQNAEILTAPIEFDPPESDSPPNRVPPKIPISISAPRATPVVPIPAQLIRTYSTPALRPRRPVDAWAFSAETDPAFV
jgi:hypothetical protein